MFVVYREFLDMLIFQNEGEIARPPLDLWSLICRSWEFKVFSTKRTLFHSEAPLNDIRDRASVTPNDYKNTGTTTEMSIFLIDEDICLRLKSTHDNRKNEMLDVWNVFQSILFIYQSSGRIIRPARTPLDHFVEEIEYFDLGQEVMECFWESEG